MGAKVILDSTLTAIANAIRSKTGESGTMTPLQMPGKIQGIVDKVAGIMLDYTETSYSNTSFSGTIPAYAFSIDNSGDDMPSPHLQTLLLPNAIKVNNFALQKQSALETVNFTSLQIADNYAFTGAFAQGSEASFPALRTAGKDCFSSTGLKTAYFPALTSIPQNFFYSAKLQYITFTHDISNILASAFYSCTQLTRIIFDCDITGSIYASVFARCTNCLLYDFSGCSAVPTLVNANAFDRINANAKIVVPDALYNDWIAATNWATYADKIVRASDYTD